MNFTFFQYFNLLKYPQISFRHDVDRKLDKSLKMAKLEHEKRENLATNEHKLARIIKTECGSDGETRRVRNLII